jgi:hypothetical protein
MIRRFTERLEEPLKFNSMTPQQEQTLRLQAKAKGWDKAKEDAYVEFVKNKTQAQIEASQPAPTPQKQAGDGFFKSLIKDPIKELIVRPGVRVAQAGIAAFGGEKGRAFAEKEQNVHLPVLGDFNIPAQKAGAAGVKQIAGDAAKTASYLYTPGAAKGAISAGLKGSIKAGVIQGAKAGAIGSALYSGGQAAQDNKSAGGILMDTLKGGAAGAAVGGVIGGAAPVVAKGIAQTGKLVSKGVEGFSSKLTKGNRIFEAITPKVNELAPTEYERLLSRGKIAPKTATKPAQYILSEGEKETAIKYGHLIEGKDPVKNTINVVEEIARQDDEVGKFLQQKNAIYNGGELKNYLVSKLDDITDVTIDKGRLGEAKNDLVTNFVDSLSKKDMHSLWQARKNFDRQIQRAFTGAPTLQKQIKIEFRNAIQDFISQKTDNVTYKGYMKDMSELFNIKDVLTNKAAKEKSYNAIQLWIKHNPTKAKIIGWTLGTGVVGAVGSSLF